MSDEQPTELRALRATTKEFLTRLATIEHELETLKADRKELLEEFKSKLDTVTLQKAMKVVKIQATVAHRDTFDTFVEVLSEE